MTSYTVETDEAVKVPDAAEVLRLSGPFRRPRAVVKEKLNHRNPRILVLLENVERLVLPGVVDDDEVGGAVGLDA